MLLLDADPYRRRGQSIWIVRQEHGDDGVGSGSCHCAFVGPLVPDLAKWEICSRREGIQAEGAEQGLASKPAPNHPTLGIKHSKICGWGPPQQRERYLHFAVVRDRKNQRHRYALADVSRCLQSQAKLGVLRQRLSG